jgi:hypothetical protein
VRNLGTISKMRTVISTKAQKATRLHAQKIAEFQEGHDSWATAVIRVSIPGLKAIESVKTLAKLYNLPYFT